jgi:hypothetical protein
MKKESKKVPVNFSINKEIIEKSKIYAEKTKRSLTQLVTDALMCYLKKI